MKKKKEEKSRFGRSWVFGAALFQSQPLPPPWKSSAYRSTGPGCCPATGVNLANTGKRRIFFYLLSSIIPFGSGRFGGVRRPAPECWQAGWWWNMGHVVRLETTSLHVESTTRRPYNAALTGDTPEPGEKSLSPRPIDIDIAM